MAAALRSSRVGGGAAGAAASLLGYGDGAWGGDIDDLLLLVPDLHLGVPGLVMTHKYRGSQQSSREVLPKFIDSTQGEPKNICKP
jgi:hypothetical protein